MLRKSLLAMALLGATTVAVPAQTVEFGRGGPSVDLRSDRQRERDFRRDEMRRDRDMTTGSVRRGRGDCRSVTIRERDEFGNMRTRTREEC